MRCKNHCTDLSSIVGVCASCLRERLFNLIQAQAQAQAQSPQQNHCNSNTNPTINRSVSPYINNRKSVNNPVTTVKHTYNNRLNHSISEKRFHNSPQIAITTGGCIGNSSSSNSKKPNFVRFPSISNLFRSNSRNNNRNSNSNRNSNGNGNIDTDTNHRVSISSCNAPSGAGGRPSSVTPSPSWFSNVLPTVSNGVVRKQQRCVSDRGMSPVRTSDDGDGDSYSYSDGSSVNESTESCKQTPLKTPLQQTVRRGGGQKSVTEMIFCPLVNVKGKLPVDVRAPVVPHISYAKSFSGNRSRKIADFGRCDPNR